MKHENDTKEVFKQCGTCSQTFGYILNREFGHPKDAEVWALDPLAGGIMNTGNQCGMLWGTALATGAESFRRNNDMDSAIAITIAASQRIIESFLNRTKTVSCREITGCDLNSVFGMAKFMLRITLQGMKNSKCFNLAEQWAPEAIQSATDGLTAEQIQYNQKPLSCASEVVKKMGASDEEIALVAGFAGGLGLSGKACGALSAAIWMKTLVWCKANPGKKPPYFKNSVTKKVLRTFKEATNSEFQCSRLSGKRFKTIDEHSLYIKNGGCQALIHTLATA